jgi:peptidoglycan hydrolase CwlO-like protein
LENYNIDNIIEDLDDQIKNYKEHIFKVKDEVQGSDKVIKILKEYIKDHETV